MHAKTTLHSKQEIGAKLGAIIQDASTRAQLIDNPTEVLGNLGVRSDATILADTADLVHIIVPAEVDEARVAAGDEAYFEELGKAALGICLYEDLPE